MTTRTRDSGGGGGERLSGEEGGNEKVRAIDGHVGENARLLLPFALCKMFFLTTRIPTAHTHPSCHPPRRPRLQYRTSLGTNFAGASIYRKEVQLYGRRVALKLYSTSKRTAW